MKDTKQENVLNKYNTIALSEVKAEAMALYGVNAETCDLFLKVCEVVAPKAKNAQLDHAIGNKEKVKLSVSEYPFEVCFRPFKGKIYIHAFRKNDDPVRPYHGVLCEITATKDGARILLRGHEARHMNFTKTMLEKHQTTGSYYDAKGNKTKEKTDTFKTSKEFSCAFNNLTTTQFVSILNKVIGLDDSMAYNDFPYDNVMIINGKEENHPVKQIKRIDLADDDERRDEE